MLIGKACSKTLIDCQLFAADSLDNAPGEVLQRSAPTFFFFFFFMLIYFCLALHNFYNCLVFGPQNPGRGSGGCSLRKGGKFV